MIVACRLFLHLTCLLVVSGRPGTCPWIYFSWHFIDCLKFDTIFCMTVKTAMYIMFYIATFVSCSRVERTLRD